jgi:excinuclease ABC subunit A
VLVIEHNLDVIKTADWVVDMGPEGGNKGGEVVAVGTPEDIAATPASYTGVFLAPILAAAPPVTPPEAPRRAAAPDRPITKAAAKRAAAAARRAETAGQTPAERLGVPEPPRPASVRG